MSGHDDHHDSDGGGRLIGLMTILLTLAGWTVAPLLIEMFTEDVDAWTSNGWRYGFAAVLWAPLIVVKLVRGRLPKGLFRAALVPGLINAAAQVVFTMSFYMIDPGLVTFGLRMQIVAVTIGAAILFPAERIVIKSPWFLLGIALVIGGTLVTATQDETFGSRAGVAGVAFAMTAGFGYACYALAVRKCMAGFGAMESFAAISQYTAVAMVILMLIFGERLGAGALDMSLSRFGLFLLSAVIGIAAGHVLYYLSIARLGVAVSTGIVQLQPFTVGVLSMLVFGETLSAWQWASGSVAVAGAIMMVIVQDAVQRRLRRARRNGGLPSVAAIGEPSVEEVAEPAVVAAFDAED